MKLREFRALKIDEVAVVLDNGKTHTAVARHNEEGGFCDCCKNWSVESAEIVLVRNAVTGQQVWPDEAISVYTVGDKTYLLKPEEAVRLKATVVPGEHGGGD